MSLVVLRSLFRETPTKKIFCEKVLAEIPISKSTNKFVKIYYEKLKEASIKSRRSELKERLRDELHEAHTRGWFVVFNTLTVDSLWLDKIFSPHSTHFKNYLRNVYRSCGRAAGLDSKTADKTHNDFHRYFAVVERGTEGGRLHIHVLHFCKYLPENSIDPNKHLIDFTRRQLDSFRYFWRYGFSTPIMIRYGHTDSWAQAGYAWPLTKDLQPLQTSGIMQVASYITKYITTSQERTTLCKQTQQTIWRTRMSRQFGNLKLIALVKTFTTKTLLTALREKARRQIYKKLLPGWRRLRLIIARELASRNALARHFLTTQSAPPILNLKKLNPDWLDKMRFTTMNFGLQRQIRTDKAISSIYDLFSKVFTDHVPYSSGGSCSATL